MADLPNTQTRNSPISSGNGAAIQTYFVSHPCAMMYRIGNLFAPHLTGLIATRAFTRTRTKPYNADCVAPLGSRSFSIEDPEVRFGYLWPGNGPTVLLIHGWSADSTSMLGFVRPLLEKGFQVAAFDAPGHGASKGKRTTMMRFVQAGFQAARGLGDVQYIVGHSLGSIATAAIAARMHQDHDAPIRAMVMIAAPQSLANVLEIWSSARSQQLPRSLRERIYARLGHDNGVPVSHWDISALTRSLNIPTLIVHDQSDTLVPFSCAEHLHNQLNSKFESTVGYGHSRILVSTEAKTATVSFLLAHK